MQSNLQFEVAMNSDVFSTMAQNHSHVVQFLTKLEFEKVFCEQVQEESQHTA